jgi:starch-binding outer membrane protein, SusD/RagB family
MKNIKVSLLYILTLGMILSSCTNDLDVEPKDDDIFTVENFYAQPDAYRKAIAGVYGNMSLTGASGPLSSFLEGIDGGTSQYGRCLWYLQDLTTDQCVWSYENDPGTRELQRNIWTADNPIILGMFARSMVGVALANEFLKQSTPDKLSSRNITNATELADIADFRNEARVVRALNYYHLLDMYGKAPFITEADPVNHQGVEYNREQLFEFVESELVAVLPSLKPARTNEYGRVDQGVANMILAKLYLNAEVYIGTPMYGECAAKCNEIIAGGYTLNSQYLNNFNADNHTSPEMIFTLQSDGNVTQNYGPTTVFVNGQVGSVELNGEDFGVGAGAWGGAIRVRKQFVQKFEGAQFANDDRNTIMAGDRPIEIASLTSQGQGYIIGKWSNKTSAGVAGPNTTFVNTDFPMFRLADVYLMYAECAVRNAPNTTIGQALSYVNQLRERANGGSTIGNIVQSALTLDFILDERVRELHWEGHRRQDLIRFNKFTTGYNWVWKGNAANGVSLPSHYKLFPLPTASIAANPNLRQNTGY